MNKITLTSENLGEIAKALKLPVLPGTKTEHTKITAHWSAGTYDVPFPDHYHFSILGDGSVVLGAPITVQVPVRTSKYLAHVARNNTNNIGVAIMCCKGASESAVIREKDWGKYPPTETQIKTMILVIAALCHQYEIPPVSSRVLGHKEHDTILGKPQNRWDITVLPDIPYKKNKDGTFDAMNWIRKEVEGLLLGKNLEEPTTPELCRALYSFAEDIKNLKKRIEFLKTLNALWNRVSC